MYCQKKDENAIIPFKVGPDEVGYDLTLIKIHKIVNDYTVMYDTGIVIKPPLGYYTEIVPRSSIYKTGWFLANNVGVIDPSYRGTLKIVLSRVYKEAPLLDLPNRLCQLIIRPLYNQFKFIQVDELDETDRNEGGFGSSDNR